MLVLPAYAKLNLALDVIGRRADGLHDIRSLLVRLDWHDLVGLRVQRAAVPAVRLRVTGDGAGVVPRDATNLAYAAVTALLDHAPEAWDVDVWLHKRVPAGAGLGGGSADAATVLRALPRLIHVDAGDDDINDTARALGSDVPALVAGGARDVSGRGDVHAAVQIPSLHIAIVATVHSDTPAAYHALHATDLRDSGRVTELIARVDQPTIDDDLLGSALEAAACRANPELADNVVRVRALTPELRWHMTGSGGALFTVVVSAAAAEAIAGALRAAGFSARACHTVAGAPEITRAAPTIR